MVAEFLLNHLWQSTLFTVAAAFLTLLFRKNHARIRYALWLAASIKFLIPFSLFIAIGNSIDFGWQASAPLPSSTINIVETISRPFNSPVLARAITASPNPYWRHLILPSAYAMWLGGFLAVLIFYVVKSRRISKEFRNAALILQGRALELLRRLEPIAGRKPPIKLASSGVLMEPGVFGIFKPVLLLPEGMAKRLSESELDAILAHELSHVRRRDNLAAAIQMFIEALFWFHPMVWWIGAKLVQERERACDEEVLRLGKDPQSYAEGILKVCEFYLEFPLACVAGVTGSNMKNRIREIMTHSIGSRLSLAKKALLTVSAISVVAAPLTIGLLNAHPSSAQSSGEPKPSFETASVKPALDVRGISIQMHLGGRLAINGAPLDFLISQAFEIQNFQISGGPAWIHSIPYDIEAKSGAPAGRDQMWLMLQALLEERFKLKMHREIKDMPGYELVIPKGGNKVKITKNDGVSSLIGEPFAPPQMPPGPDGKPMVQSPGTIWQFGNQLQGKAIQLDELAKSLSRILGRSVIDKTGLAGAYDFNLKWNPDNSQTNSVNAANVSGNSAPSADLSEPSIITAIQEQLGLKLALSKVQGEFFIVDSVDKPSEN